MDTIQASESSIYYELYQLNKKLMLDNDFRKYIMNAWAEWEGPSAEQNLFILVEKARKERDIFRR
jgi:hypothetical protein